MLGRERQVKLADIKRKIEKWRKGVKKVMVIIGIMVLIIAAAIAGLVIYNLKMTGEVHVLDGPGMSNVLQVMDGGNSINPDAVKNQLEGIWGEYEYSFGERIVLEGTTLKLKDCGEYVFETAIDDAYEVSDYEGRIIMRLQNPNVTKNGKSYGTVKECYYEKQVIHMVYEFSFGERDLEFEYAENPEFYYYDMVTDEMMPQLEGTWRNGSNSFVIKDGTLQFYYENEAYGEANNICVVKENTSASGRVFVANENLFLEGIGEYSWFKYEDGKLSAVWMVLDDDRETVIFTKD